MAQIERLSIALTKELTADIRRAVEAGEYASASEAIRDALRSWKSTRERRAAALEELKRLWRDGVDSGAATEINAEEIKRRGRQRLAALSSG
jgi:antitoxin ParD1/3/4